RKAGELGNRAHRGPAHGAVQGHPHPSRRTQLKKRMRYVSTRGGLEPSSFSEILLGGLAPDGGLVVPEEYPRIDAATLASWRGLSYPELAFEILRRYATDIDEATLRALIARTYTAEVFGSPD